MIKCALCMKPTNNPRFCSRSCSAKITNKEVHRRKRKPRYCKYCNIEIFGQFTCCFDCNPSKLIDLNTTKLIDIKSKRHYQKHSRIRVWARNSIIKSGKPMICQVCGYSKHVEVAHKKAISSFPKDTLISKINNPKNLLILCRNCHWELDHNMIKIKNK